jgi:hypothetical protein
MTQSSKTKKTKLQTKLEKIIWPDINDDWQVNEYNWITNNYEPTNEQSTYIKSALHKIENLKNK